jgi:hypothetical protein
LKEEARIWFAFGERYSLDPPQANTQVREVPIASGPKLRAAFLLLRFLWPAKKMKVYELGHFLVLTA